MVSVIGSNAELWKGDAILASLEATFYYFATDERPHGRVVSWIRDCSMKDIAMIQGLFALSNFFFTFLEGSRFYENATGIIFKEGVKAGSSYYAFNIGVAALSIYAVYNFFQRAKNAQQETELTPELKVTKNDISLPQFFTHLFQVSRLTMTVANACFMTNPYLAAITILGASYSLLKNMDIKWSRVDVKLPPFTLSDRALTYVELKGIYTIRQLANVNENEGLVIPIPSPQDIQTGFLQIHRGMNGFSEIHKDGRVDGCSITYDASVQLPAALDRECIEFFARWNGHSGFCTPSPK
jgi:hypothetical protein